MTTQLVDIGNDKYPETNDVEDNWCWHLATNRAGGDRLSEVGIAGGEFAAAVAVYRTVPS